MSCETEFFQNVLAGKIQESEILEIIENDYSKAFEIFLKQRLLEALLERGFVSVDEITFRTWLFTCLLTKSSKCLEILKAYFEFDEKQFRC